MLSKGSLDKLHVHGHTMDSWSNWEEEELRERGERRGWAAQYWVKGASCHSAVVETQVSNRGTDGQQLRFTQSNSVYSADDESETGENSSAAQRTNSQRRSKRKPPKSSAFLDHIHRPQCSAAWLTQQLCSSPNSTQYIQWAELCSA